MDKEDKERKAAYANAKTLEEITLRCFLHQPAHLSCQFTHNHQIITSLAYLIKPTIPLHLKYTHTHIGNI